MKIPVKYLNFNSESPDRGYWDMHQLQRIFERPEFEIVDELGDYGVVVIPARHNVEHADKIQKYINKLKGVVLIVAGDEEGTFPTPLMSHRNMKLWLMTPRAGEQYKNVDRFIGEGYTPHCDLIKEFPEKTLNWFFAGQITHANRVRCAKQLRRMDGGELIETKEFAGGISNEEYINRMAIAKVVPCPSGPVTPDTFRFYEALELGSIPIADKTASGNKNPGYWELLFGSDYPFPTVKMWNGIRNTINYYNDRFYPESNKIFAWWQIYKRNLVFNLIDDFAMVKDGGVYNKRKSGVTAIIPTSPIASNPDTKIIEETINSVRAHLSDCEIIITFDGVREEQESYRVNYEQYIRRILWKCNKEWKNIVPIVFDEPMHQVAMCREALEYVRTDKILYMEHDTPITPDLPIEWSGIYEMIDSGRANMVRFHFEAFIPEEHKEMMLDQTPQEVCGIKAIRTAQWSQRPHVASTEFYDQVLRDHFTADARTFIEDKMHGVLINIYNRQQVAGWNKYKVWIYHPDENIKRSYHTDGRASDPKFDDKLIF